MPVWHIGNASKSELYKVASLEIYWGNRFSSPQRKLSEWLKALKQTIKINAKINCVKEIIFGHFN